MLKSMTGFGKRESLLQGTTVGVEIRSVNHRYCEILVRLPKMLSGMELELKELVKGICERGRTEVTVTMNGGSNSGTKVVNVDRKMARRYVHGLEALQKEFKLGGNVDVSVLAGFRDIFSVSEEVPSLQEVPKTVLGLTRRALSDLEKMRRKEGAILQKDVQQRLQVFDTRLQTIRHRVPLALQANVDRLKTRIAKLLDGEPINSDRVAQEAVIYAERSDVTEELTRLQSHLLQFRAALKAREPVGKRLDFLLQEMGREVNTIGSKANDADISGQVVELKSELEKIREQIQNIE